MDGGTTIVQCEWCSMFFLVLVGCHIGEINDITWCRGRKFQEIIISGKKKICRTYSAELPLTGIGSLISM